MKLFSHTQQIFLCVSPVIVPKELEHAQTEKLPYDDVYAVWYMMMHFSNFKSHFMGN